MISIICTTNRTDSNSLKLSELYKRKIEELDEPCQILDLRTVPAHWIEDSNYGNNTPEFDALTEKYIRSVGKLIFITPEYNGSFPGYVKFFMDACNWGDFSGKRVALTGLATGRSGNLRGLDHLTGILHYLGSEVYSKKVCISQVNQSINKDGALNDAQAEKEIEEQLKGFINF
ncbi:NADPH-dependent FMN reductase [Bacteroidota bacterium]